MFQLTPQMRILVASEPVDGRMGIDRLAGYCRQHLEEDPMSGCVFVFRTRRATTVILLVFDGRGYWYDTPEAWPLNLQSARPAR